MGGLLDFFPNNPIYSLVAHNCVINQKHNQVGSNEITMNIIITGASKYIRHQIIHKFEIPSELVGILFV